MKSSKFVDVNSTKEGKKKKINIPLPKMPGQVKEKAELIEAAQRLVQAFKNLPDCNESSSPKKKVILVPKKKS